MAQLGARYTDAEIEDIHHLWRYVGRLVGVTLAGLRRPGQPYWLRSLSETFQLQ